MCATKRCMSLGLYGPGDKISLLEGLELVKVALSWTCCARKGLRPGSWVMLLRGLLSLHEVPSLTMDGL